MIHSDWINTKDETPDDRETVLGFSPTQGMGLVYFHEYTAKPDGPQFQDWAWLNKGVEQSNITVYDITHWMYVTTP